MLKFSLNNSLSMEHTKPQSKHDAKNLKEKPRNLLMDRTDQPISPAAYAKS